MSFHSPEFKLSKSAYLKKNIKNIRSLALILLYIYVFNFLRIYLPYLNYIVNYNYIATELCENKNKPQVHCNGKCHVQKEIKKLVDEESQPDKTPATFKIIVFQELPTTSSRLGQLYQLSIINRSKLLPINYSSPAPEISSPPPKISWIYLWVFGMSNRFPVLHRNYFALYSIPIIPLLIYNSAILIC